MIQSYGGIFIFLVLILDSIPIVGSFIPGMMLILFAGFLARIGMISLWFVLFVVISAAICGDTLSYIIGRKHGYSFIQRFEDTFLFKKKHIERTKRLMHTHTKKVLILGRFNSITRPFTSFIAGSTHVPLKKFLWSNLLSGILWGSIFVILGFLIGENYVLASKYIGRSVFVLFIFLAVFLYFFIFYDTK